MTCDFSAQSTNNATRVVLDLINGNKVSYHIYLVKYPFTYMAIDR